MQSGGGHSRQGPGTKAEVRGMVSLGSLGTSHGGDGASVGASVWGVSCGAPELLS